MAKAPSGVENLDFEHLGDQELREVMQRIKEALNARFTSRIGEFRELAREAGFLVTLTKIGEEKSGRTGRRAQADGAGDDRRRGVSAKYRNPDNPVETWAGRGRKPKWVEDRIAQGASLDDLLINRADAQQNGVEAGSV
jgi:DNA-binding protein H-NS